MDKTEDISEAAWIAAGEALGAPNVYAGRVSHLLLRERFARAILSAQSQAYIDAARALERIKPIGDTAKLLEGDVFIPTAGGFVRLSQAILQRKEEIGRN